MSGLVSWFSGWLSPDFQYAQVQDDRVVDKKDQAEISVAKGNDVAQVPEELESEQEDVEQQQQEEQQEYIMVEERELDLENVSVEEVGYDMREKRKFPVKTVMIYIGCMLLATSLVIGLNSELIKSKLPLLSFSTSSSSSPVLDDAGLWSVHLEPSDNEPVKVCVSMRHEASPQKVSMFLRNYLRRWGGELEFYFVEKMFDEMMNEYFAAGVLTKDDLDTKILPGEDCPLGWPKLHAHNIRHVIGVTDPTYDGPLIVTGDEYCLCDGRPGRICGRGGSGTFRQYYSTQYLGKLSYVPLGPRFEWKLADPEEIKMASQRVLPYNFQGSVTSISRKFLLDVLQDDKVIKKYPEVTKGQVMSAGAFKKFVVDNPGLSKPGDYRNILLESVFTLCPSGANPEAYRIYEAIDAGSIPVLCLDDFYFDHDCKGPFVPFFESNAPFIFLNSWAEWPPLLERLMKDKDALDRKQRELAAWRATFWADVAKHVDCKILQYYEKDPNFHFDMVRFCDPKPVPLPKGLTYGHDQSLNYNFIGQTLELAVKVNSHF